MPVADAKLLYRSTYSRVHRVETEGAASLRITPRIPGNASHVAKLHHEYELLQLLDRPVGLVDVDLPGQRGAQALDLPDPGGEPLSKQLVDGALPVEDALWIGIELARVLNALHRKRVLHKDVNPHNLLVDMTSLQVHLSCHSIASRLPRETHQVVHPGVLEGRLQYVSPEQTGRMNRGVDYRSDFYSLGATLYELLVGEPPFVGLDALGLVHAHIASAPRPPHEINPELPRPLSAIVLRLLAKNAEDRYQSAAGIIDDLRTCQGMVASGDVNEDFQAGAHDASELFRVPEKLYGRDSEVSSLLKAFERVASGDRELLLVSGYSGIGKSALVHEVHKPIVERRGYFVHGKFEQFRRGIPYLAFGAAFRELVHQVLTQSADDVANWRSRILAAVGDSAQVLIDVIPDLEVILGRQPAVPELDPPDAERRFAALFKHFVGVFANEQPLVVFLDDLQWADQASLKLIRTLMTDESPIQLLLIGAYRDNEVSQVHPLMLTLAELEKSTSGARSEIVLAPLSERDVASLVADTLRADVEATRDLAVQMLNKTRGNPFFLIQFFEAVHKEGLIWRDLDSGQWQYNREGIDDLQSTDNVVDLMVRRLRGLPEETQELLRMAACMGTRFDLSNLATVTRKTPGDAATLLWSAVQAGMIVPLLGTSRADAEPESEDAAIPSYIENLAESYRFLHDRVQQGAYLLSSDAQRPAMHRDIGWLLLRNASAQELEERIFDVVDHLNSARGLLDDEETLELIRLNVMAGLRARSATAYEAANGYAEAAHGLLEGDPWQEHYDLMSQLVRLRADCRYLLGHHDEAEPLFDEVLANVRETDVKVTVFNQKAVMYRHNNRYDDGLRAAIAGLALVDIEIPWHEDAERIGALMGELGAAVAGRLADVEDLQSLLDLPTATDATHIAAIDLLEEVIMVGYFFNPALSQVGTMNVVLASLDKGNCRGSAPAWATYGMTIASAMGRYPEGGALGRVGLELARRVFDDATIAKTSMWYAAMVGHWHRPAEECLDILKDGVEKGIRVGAPISAAYNAFFVPVVSRFIGTRLDEVGEVLDRYQLIMDNESGEATVAYRQFVRSLTGRIAGGGQFSGGTWRDKTELVESEYVQFMHDSGLALSRQHYYNARLQLLVYWNRPADGLEIMKTAQGEGDMAAILFGQLVLAEFALFRVLAMTGAWPDLDAATRAEYGPAIEAHLASLATWAEHEPSNFRQLHLLAAAEKASIDGGQEDATRLYDEAIDAAHAAGHPNIEALAAERAARFHLDGGRDSFAGGYLTLAHTRYVLWGAVAKAGALALEFPTVIGSASDADLALRQSDLDVATVVRAFQAMSQEIELHALLERMLAILAQNAGAERGALLLRRDGQLYVEAATSGDGVEIVGSKSMDSRDDIPKTLVAYANRTGETVVLDDASKDRRFAADPVVQATGLKSALCMPIVHQRRNLGVLFLANNLSTGAFTPDRAALLEILGTQAAISIDNACLFDRQKRQAASFARFVPQQFLEHIGRDSIDEVRVGDAVERAISVLFSDLRDFTELSESMSVHENFRWLNGYLGYLSPVIEQHSGFIDKFIGDAVMALFPGSADQAVGAAIDLHEALRRFNRASQVPFETLMGVGIHTGPLMLGTVGSQGRMDTTVIGDAVNLAARLEGLTKYFGANVLISGDTHKALDGLAETPVRVLGRVRVKGRSEFTTLYEVLAADAPAARHAKLANADRFAEGTDLFFRRRFEAAARAFGACLEDDPNDQPAQCFVDRAFEMAAQRLPDDWDGTETFRFK